MARLLLDVGEQHLLRLGGARGRRVARAPAVARAWPASAPRSAGPGCARGPRAPGCGARCRRCGRRSTRSPAARAPPSGRSPRAAPGARPRSQSTSATGAAAGCGGATGPAGSWPVGCWISCSAVSLRLQGNCLALLAIEPISLAFTALSSFMGLRAQRCAGSISRSPAVPILIERCACRWPSGSPRTTRSSRAGRELAGRPPGGGAAAICREVQDSRGSRLQSNWSRFAGDRSPRIDGRPDRPLWQANDRADWPARGIRLRRRLALDGRIAA